MKPAGITVSREGRDTIWLLAMLGLCIAPHLGRLPLWCSLGTIAAMLWRGRVAMRDGALPPRWLLLVALAVSMALTLLTFRTLFGREAGVTLVTLLAGLKTLELRARRDAFVVTSLAFFLILTQFLYSQSLPIAALMLMATIGLLTSLVLVQRPLGRPTISSALWAASKSVLMGIPVMLTMFMLFPRLGPLWSAPADARARIGLSERIDLGSMSDLAQDDSVAMRVRFPNGPPMARNLYFRGPTLDVFDGRTWHASKDAPQRQGISVQDQVQPLGGPVRYQVTIEPHRITSMPLLDGTTQARPTPPLTEPVLRNEGLNWRVQSPLNERAQIDAMAWQYVRSSPVGGPQAMGMWLQLPHGFNPRTLAWARQLQQQPELANADGRTLTQAVLRHITNAGYTYTLTPFEGREDKPAQRHTIDDFWINRKRGFCEHFATAYVVVMRAMGIPSRVVTGYQGAERNPVDGLFVVRNSDAHAWAEYWQAGEGWVRVDPTAAVAPNRIERNLDSFRRGNELPGPLSNVAPELWGKMRAYMDAGNHQWNVWVLQYSRSRQMALLQNLGFSTPNWVDLIRVAGGVLGFLAALGLVWLWWSRPMVDKSSWRQPLNRVHRAMVLSGIPEPGTSPAPAAALSWVRMLDQVKANATQAALKPQLQGLLAELDALRYAPRVGTRAEARRLRASLVTRIEQLSHAWRAARQKDRAN